MDLHSKSVKQIGQFLAKNPTQARFKDEINVYFNLLKNSIIIIWKSSAPVGGHDTYTLQDYESINKNIEIKNSNLNVSIKEAFNSIRKIIQTAPIGSQFEYGKYTKNFKWFKYMPFEEIYGFNINNMIESIKSLKK